MAVYKDEKRGTWYAAVSVKDAVTGKFKVKKKRGFKLKRDAMQWEAAQSKEVNVPKEPAQEEKHIPTFREMDQLYLDGSLTASENNHIQ